MLRAILLLLAVAGHHARPLKDTHRFRNSGWMIKGPQIVQDEVKQNSVHPKGAEPSNHLQMDFNIGVKHKENQKSVPVELRRQGTEPSRRFLMDLNAGMLKEEVGEMNRRVAGFYNPPAYEMRKGTQNSHTTLVDPITGQMLYPITEMQRSTAPLDEFRQGTEYRPHILKVLRMRDILRSQYSAVGEKHEQRVVPAELLMDLNTGLLKEHRNHMDRRVPGSKWEVVSGPEHEEMKNQDFSGPKENKNSVPVELRRQGTEPSRRFLMDLNAGMLKEEVGEMNRRVAGFYNPPAYEVRKGTQNSHTTLVDPITGQMLYPITEMQRSTAPLDEFRQGTEYRPHILKVLRMRDILRSQYSAVGEKHEQRVVPAELLMDLNTGLLKEHRNHMDRRLPGSKWDVVSGPEHEEMKNQDFSGPKENKNSVHVELRRQGTEPSRRFLMDLNAGMLKEKVGEMNRRVAGFYNPPAYEMRKGTQNSHTTLVDPITGQMLYPITEMQRSTAPLDEFRQGTEYRPHILKVLRMRDILRSQYSAVGEKHEQRVVPAELLMDLNTGLLKEHRNHMDRRVPGSKWEVVSGPEHEEMKNQDFSGPKENKNSVHVELRRQGTEPSRRFLMDLNAGMLKEEVGEMNRRVAGFYNPPAYEVRKGTQNSHTTLVDPITGQMLYPITEMQRSTAPLDEFRQGTEYRPHILKVLRMRDILRSQYSAVGEKHEQRVIPAELHRQGEDKASCQGEVIQGKCYSFNPTPQTFKEAEVSCQKLSSRGHLASVASAEVHKQLVSMVTKAKNGPVLTWLGGTQKENKFQWIDGSSWTYSDWMPGHPHKHNVSCLEMFRIDESWWTAVDCSEKRAFICSFPMTV
ncbi:uncharacterized protein LOC127443364 [Myxocyprinus asiaticus]|uniref:uncharacterized protein LOC127443364 n=1 Tax=Myxocyprinus asiaticus TaxID=70543 RepID=UPI00222373DA|nr:uncharacterized protein LOC127443364 [Myxocyprinus asiaticus]